MSQIEADLVAVLGNPAYLMGFAAGDVLKVGSDHPFEVVARDGNVCVQVFADPPLTGEAIDALESAFSPLDGEVESPGHRRFAVVTVPTAGWYARPFR